MRRRLLLCVGALLGVLWAQGAAAAGPTLPEVAAPPDAEDVALRPSEAPLLVEPAPLPPAPPEYLRHDEDGIRFSYHPSARERVRLMIEEAPLARDELSDRLGRSVLADIEVRVAVGPSDLSRIVPAEVRRNTEVVALTQYQALVLGLAPAPMSAGRARAHFRRGLAYLALDQVAGPTALPQWFRVGFAVHFADEVSFADRRALWWAAAEERVIPLVDLDWFIGGPPVPGDVATAQARDFLEFLLEEPREGGFVATLDAVRGGEDDFQTALETGYQSSFAGLEKAWRGRLARVHVFVPLLAASMGLWVFLAVGITARRRWRSRKRDQDERSSVALVEAVEALPDDGKDRTFIELADYEVPKVSHDGRWHTLH